MASSYAAALACFKEGSGVEVTSDKICDRGALFPATIIAAKPRTSQFIVKYETLQGDRNGFIQEAVDWGLVRPRQPLDDDDRDFELGETVDVFFDGGWWEGAITRVVNSSRSRSGSGSRYVVFFKFSRQQRRLTKSQMRAHREWIAGIWNPPPPPQQQQQGEPVCSIIKVDPVFREGMHVEVRIKEDGFQGSWFLAAIIKPTREDKFLVQYHTLRTDLDLEEGGFLKEEISASYMRPLPPPPLALPLIDSYILDDRVDAFYNDGWWEGVVTRVVEYGSRYQVYFKLTDDEMVFHHSKLRPHQDWIHGQWRRMMTSTSSRSSGM